MLAPKFLQAPQGPQGPRALLKTAQISHPGATLGQENRPEMALNPEEQCQSPFRSTRTRSPTLSNDKQRSDQTFWILGHPIRGVLWPVGRYSGPFCHPRTPFRLIRARNQHLAMSWHALQLQGIATPTPWPPSSSFFAAVVFAGGSTVRLAALC